MAVRRPADISSPHLCLRVTPVCLARFRLIGHWAEKSCLASATSSAVFLFCFSCCNILACLPLPRGFTWFSFLSRAYMSFVLLRGRGDYHLFWSRRRSKVEREQWEECWSSRSRLLLGACTCFFFFYSFCNSRFRRCSVTMRQRKPVDASAHLPRSRVEPLIKGYSGDFFIIPTCLKICWTRRRTSLK